MFPTSNYGKKRFDLFLKGAIDQSIDVTRGYETSRCNLVTIQPAKPIQTTYFPHTAMVFRVETAEKTAPETDWERGATPKIKIRRRL